MGVPVALMGSLCQLFATKYFRPYASRSQGSCSSEHLPSFVPFHLLIVVNESLHTPRGKLDRKGKSMTKDSSNSEHFPRFVLNVFYLGLRRTGCVWEKIVQYNTGAGLQSFHWWGKKRKKYIYTFFLLKNHTKFDTNYVFVSYLHS